MRKKVNKNLLLGFIAPYLLVVMIVFIAQYISNSIVLNALEDNAMNIVENSFENDIAVIEQNLDRVKETAAIVAQNTSAQMDMIDRNKNDFYTKLTDMRKQLSSYFVGNSVIKDICIQNDKRDYLINFEVAYSNRLSYYTTMIHSDNMRAEEQLKVSETANGFSTENSCTYSDGTKAVPFVFPTPMMKKRTGSVLVYVDKKEMLMPIQDLISQSGGIMEIVDKKGKSVLREGEADIEFPRENIDGRAKKKIEGDDYYIFSSNGNASGWKYIILLPEGYVLSGVVYYQVFSLALNFIILLIGFAMCLFFTVRKSNSYLELLEMLGLQPEKFKIKSLVSKDEYIGLRNHISKIKDENMLLLEKGNQSVLRNILNGKYERAEDINRELKSHYMEFTCNEYGVFAIRYINKELSDANVKRLDVFLAEKLGKIIPNAKICLVDRNVIAVIMPFDGGSHTDAMSLYLKKIQEEIFEKYHICALVGVGKTVKELIELSESYNEACETLDYNFLMDGQKLYFYSELPKSDDDYYYPIETENALFKSALESDFETARNVLRKIQEENFINRSLCAGAINELLAELRASIKKISRLQSEYLEFSQEECSVNHFFEHAISFIYMICSDTDREKGPQTRGNKLCLEIKNYIELHYANSNLSLDLIAEEFRIHPNYLSNLFKKCTGYNLISYLENIRIEKAEELLASGKYTVNEVALGVGFSNDATFRRRFKKIKGVPPSTYLKC